MNIKINSYKFSDVNPIQLKKIKDLPNRGSIPFRGLDEFVTNFENPIKISEAISSILKSIRTKNFTEAERNFLNPDPMLISLDKLILKAKRIGSKINLEVIYSHPNADGSIPIASGSAEKIEEQINKSGFMKAFNKKLAETSDKIYFNKISRLED